MAAAGIVTAHDAWNNMGALQRVYGVGPITYEKIRKAVRSVASYQPTDHVLSADPSVWSADDLAFIRTLLQAGELAPLLEDNTMREHMVQLWAAGNELHTMTTIGHWIRRSRRKRARDLYSLLEQEKSNEWVSSVEEKFNGALTRSAMWERQSSLTDSEVGMAWKDRCLVLIALANKTIKEGSGIQPPAPPPIIKPPTPSDHQPSLPVVGVSRTSHQEPTDVVVTTAPRSAGTRKPKSRSERSPSPDEPLRTHHQAPGQGSKYTSSETPRTLSKEEVVASWKDISHSGELLGDVSATAGSSDTPAPNTRDVLGPPAAPPTTPTQPPTPARGPRPPALPSIEEIRAARKDSSELDALFRAALSDGPEMDVVPRDAAAHEGLTTDPLHQEESITSHLTMPPPPVAPAATTNITSEKIRAARNAAAELDALLIDCHPAREVPHEVVFRAPNGTPGLETAQPQGSFVPLQVTPDPSLSEVITTVPSLTPPRILLDPKDILAVREDTGKVDAILLPVFSDTEDVAKESNVFRKTSEEILDEKCLSLAVSLAGQTSWGKTAVEDLLAGLGLPFISAAIERINDTAVGLYGAGLISGDGPFDIDPDIAKEFLS